MTPEEQRKQLEELTKEMKKNNDSLSGVDKAFSSFGDDFKAYAANAQNITDGLANFLDMREDSLAGFGRELTASFRATQKWADRIKFDIATFADENIRDVNEGIRSFEEMQSETGKTFEKRMGALMESLRTADQGEAIAILQQIHAMREEAHKSLSEEEAARLDFMAKTAQRGLDSISSNTSILKGAIMETLPSLDKFAESVLGGGILGKFAGTVIRKKRQEKEARASAQAMATAGGQQDASMAAQSAAIAGASEGGKDLALQLSQQAIISELREINKHNRRVLGLEESQLDEQKKQTEGALDNKESESEALAIDERQHDETVAALKAGGGMGGDGDCPKIPGGFMDAVLGALSGKWIAQAASFLMTPLKKVVGAVAGGVGKAVGFIMPKKWTAGLSKFFKTTDKAQAASIGKASKSAGLLTKLTDKFKGLVKGLVDTLKNIFKSIGEVINNIVKSVGKVIKSIGKGIADMMKQLARGIGYFGKKSVLLGAAALILVSGGIFVFSKAMVEFTKVSWKAVGVAAVSLLLLVGTIAALGAIMMSGVGAVALVLGAAALVIVAGGLFVLGKAMQEFAKALNIAMPFFEWIGNFILNVFSAMVPIIEAVGQAISLIISTLATGAVDIIGAITDTFERLGQAGIGTGLLATAAGIAAVTAALAAFMAVQIGGGLLGAVGNVVAGVGNWIAGWFGAEAAPTPMEILGALASFPVDGLKEAPAAIDGMIAALQRFSALEIDGDQARETIGVIAALGGALKAFQVNEPGLLGSIGNFLGGALKKATGWLGSLLGIEASEDKDPMQILKDLIALSPQIVKMGPAMQQFTGGLMALMQVAEAEVNTKNFDRLFGSIVKIPTGLINDQARAFNNLASSINNVATEMQELDMRDIQNAGYALQLAQQQNTQVKEKTAWWNIPGHLYDMAEKAVERNNPPPIQAPMQISSNNSQHFHGNINARNPDTSLNNLLSRRR